MYTSQLDFFFDEEMAEQIYNVNSLKLGEIGAFLFCRVIFVLKNVLVNADTILEMIRNSLKFT